jgi:hypothetical protein
MAKVTFEGQVTCLCESHYYRWLDRMRAARVVVRLRKLEAEHGALPATVEAITGHGRHLYFKMPGISVRNSESRIAPKIDVRGSGGYALCPPSLHPSGKRYAWSVDSAKAFAAAPDWLLARIASAPTAAQRWRRHRRNGAP